VLTRPEGLRDDEVAEAVGSEWGLDVMGVEHLGVGFGSHHWKVVGHGHRWFITVDDLAPPHTADIELGRLQVALTTARQLRERGLSFVVAPRNRTCGPGSRRTAHLPSLLPGVARTLTAGRGGDRCTGRGGRRVRSWVPSQR
jgi:hypothetical protein